MAKNAIRTSKKVASKASRVLQSRRTSSTTKSLGGSVLVNRKKGSTKRKK